MSIGLLIISHDHVGRTLLETVARTLGRCPLATEVLDASRDCNPDSLVAQARDAVAALDRGDGVLVVTDLYGSTPSNIAARLVNDERVRVVTGVNLPMLIRIFNYPQLGLDQLVEKAVSGGRDGIFPVIREG